MLRLGMPLYFFLVNCERSLAVIGGSGRMDPKQWALSLPLQCAQTDGAPDVAGQCT